MSRSTEGQDGAGRAYKSLSRVERAFRSFKGVDLKVRPVHHRLARRVRAHVFLCMLAHHVEWHMRRALAPLLFDDDDPAAAEAVRASPVAPARRSRPKPSASSASAHDPYPVAYTRGSALCHRTAITCPLPPRRTSG